MLFNLKHTLNLFRMQNRVERVNACFYSTSSTNILQSESVQLGKSVSMAMLNRVKDFLGERKIHTLANKLYYYVRPCVRYYEQIYRFQRVAVLGLR